MNVRSIRSIRSISLSQLISATMTALLSCSFFIALVGWISYRRTRGQTNSRDGYFLAGHGLTGTFIAGSLLLTNLSAEQLIGLNGSAYAFNLSSMAWEVTAAVAIGVVGAAYAIFGGLKAVAVSDTLNGFGLLIVGLLVPVLGLIRLGKGDFKAGLNLLTSEHTEKLSAIGTATDPTPFGTLFTGMIFANLFYWGTNHYVIQRTLGAASLAEGQKGVVISGFFKIAVPFLMMIPGVIAYHPARPDTDDEKLIRVARMFGTGLALLSFLIAPALQYAPEGVWQPTGF